MSRSDSDGVPSCDTGLGGRVRFVVTELRGLARDIRTHRRERAAQQADPGDAGRAEDDTP